MEKKINKKQKEVQEARHEREKKKVVYDFSVVIIEGQRNTIRELESKSDIMLQDFLAADNMVKDRMNELNELSSQLEEEITPEPAN